MPGALSLEHSLRVLRTSSLVTVSHSLVGCCGRWWGRGLVFGGVLGNHEFARSSAFPSVSEIHVGNFMSGEFGSFRVGTTVFLMPWYHDVSHQRSEPGFTDVAKALTWEHLATTIW